MAEGPPDERTTQTGRAPGAWAYFTFSGQLVCLGIGLIVAQLADGQGRNVSFALMFLVLGGMGLALQGWGNESNKRLQLYRRSLALLAVLLVVWVSAAVAAIALRDFGWSDVVFGGLWVVIGVALGRAWQRIVPGSAGGSEPVGAGTGSDPVSYRLLKVSRSGRWAVGYSCRRLGGN